MNRFLPFLRPTPAILPLAIIGIALFVAIFDNTAFFNLVLQSSAADDHQLAIVVAMFVVIVCTLVILLTLAAGARLFKIVAACVLLVASACSYYMSEYGIVFDTSMIRNVAETEIREAAPLVTAGFLLHVGVFGLMPALAVLFLPLRRVGWRREAVHRTCTLLGAALILTGTLYFNYASIASFGQEHHAVRMQINPLYPLYSLFRYATRADDKPPTLRSPLQATVAKSRSITDKPTLIVFVMGETARADRFSLNGYPRDTNRYTRAFDIVNFDAVRACGTSTADSVPCVFSHLARTDFTHSQFAEQESLLGTLSRLGVQTFWRDNSTGCKFVCNPNDFEQLATADDPDFCDDAGCFDELLLKDLNELIADDAHDHFIVLHQRGSHGPAYFSDTPEWSKAFLPECRLKNLRDCSLDDINNAYDNTIVYTDYFLAQVISRLKQESDRFDSAMFYVSDHGESLGEKGLYLHGLPYSFAPAEQIEVPMIFWGSPGFYESENLDSHCVAGVARKPTSHDAVFHTVLPLFGIESPAYQPALDVFSTCRSPAGSTMSNRTQPKLAQR